jgi:hypothetical protein
MLLLDKKEIFLDDVQQNVVPFQNQSHITIESQVKRFHEEIKVAFKIKV